MRYYNRWHHNPWTIIITNKGFKSKKWGSLLERCLLTITRFASRCRLTVMNEHKQWQLPIFAMWIFWEIMKLKTIFGVFWFIGQQIEELDGFGVLKKINFLGKQLSNIPGYRWIGLPLSDSSSSDCMTSSDSNPFVVCSSSHKHFIFTCNDRLDSTLREFHWQSYGAFAEQNSAPVESVEPSNSTMSIRQPYQTRLIQELLGLNVRQSKKFMTKELADPAG